jgi:hypothetical protein
MHAAVRSPLMTGIALAGAGAIAMSPLVVPPEEVEAAASRISTAAVQLTANPLAIYGEAISTALEEAAPLVERLTEIVGPTLSPAFLAFLAEAGVENATALVGLLNPATLTEWLGGIPGAAQTYAGVLTPFLQSVLANIGTAVPSALQEALGLLTSGDFEGALNTVLGLPLDIVGLGVLGPLLATGPFLGAVLPPIPIIDDIVDGVMDNSLGLLLGIGPLMNLPGAFGTGVQGVIDAVAGGDPLGAVNALIAIPGTILDGVLNGGYGPGLPFLGPFPGLLGTNGTLTVLLNTVEDILANMGWPPAPAVAETEMAVTSAPDESAATFTLSVADTEAGVEATSTGAETTPPSDESAGEEAAVATESASEEGEAEAEEETVPADDEAEEGSSDDGDTAEDDATTDGNKVEPGTDTTGAGEGSGDGSSVTDGDQTGDDSTDAGASDASDGADSGGGES